jgi:hypothetical protein
VLIHLVLALQSVTSGGSSMAPSGPIPRAQVRFAKVVYALEQSAEAYELWSVDERTGAAAQTLTGVSFEELELVGYAAKDRLRRDLPSWRQTDATEYVQLPGNLGALYRVSHGAAESLVQIDATHGARVLYSATQAGPIEKEIHVDTHGSVVLGASEMGAGGDVFALFPASGAPAINLTENLAPLDVDASSLRSAGGFAWFLADHQLHLASIASGSAQAVDLPLFSGESIHSDLVIASESADVVAILIDGVQQLSRALCVSSAGEVTLVWEEPSELASAGYDDPLGPWIAISADGQLIALRESGLTGEELWVWSAEAQSSRVHVTSNPTFPVYIDNVGILAFAGLRSLCFFGGDSFVSGSLPGELGAADMYVASFAADGSFEVSNVSRSSGQTFPPFNEPGQLTVVEAYVDPAVRNIITVSAAEPSGRSVGYFGLQSSAPFATNFFTLFENLEEIPKLEARGAKLLAETESDVEDDSEGLSIFEVNRGEPFSPLDTELESLADVVTSPGGRYAAIAERESSDRQLSWIDLLRATPTPISIGPSQQDVSRQVIFSASGRLHAGFTNGTTTQYLAFVSPTNVRILALPNVRGFPLAH